MQNKTYTPLSLEIFIYTDPKEFANCKYKPFGEIPEEYWEGFAGINNGKCTGFAVKNPNEIHIYVEEWCTDTELIETVGHEVGHLMPKAKVFINEESKAGYYEQFVGDVYRIYCMIKESL